MGGDLELFDPELFQVPTVRAPGSNEQIHLVSWGLGVESSAYLVEVLSDPDFYGVDPSRMIVLHAVVGNEWEQTYRDAEQCLLPVLADRGVRTVQLSRKGPLESDGIVVLDDTTRPRRIQRRGPWTLGMESKVTGTVPQLSHRRCPVDCTNRTRSRMVIVLIGRSGAWLTCDDGSWTGSWICLAWELSGLRQESSHHS